MKRNTSERGSALLMVTVVTMIIIGISGAYMTVSYVNTRKADQDANGVRALYIAETAAAMVINMVNHPPTSPNLPGRPSTIEAFQPMAGGYYLIPTLAKPAGSLASGTPDFKPKSSTDVQQICFDDKTEVA